MKRLLVLAVLAIAAVLPGATAHSDTYCVETGIEIMGEPWFSHRECVDCPIGPDCPGLPDLGRTH